MNLDQVRSDLLAEKEKQEKIKNDAHLKILEIGKKLRSLALIERDANELFKVENSAHGYTEGANHQ